MTSTKFAHADPTSGEITARLMPAPSPTHVYLFGSRARRDDAVDSDYDMFLVVDQPDVPYHNRGRAAFAALWGVDASVDILILTREEFDRQARVTTSLPSTVWRAGELVYAA